MTPHPDLSTKAGRKAYKHELRMVAARPRRIGMALLAGALLLWLLPLTVGIHAIAGWSPVLLGGILLVAALPFLIVGKLRRARYHRGRMAAIHPHLP